MYPYGYYIALVGSQENDGLMKPRKSKVKKYGFNKNK